MSAHVFSEIFLHINWHTDGDRPVLTPMIERFVQNFIRNSCRQTDGVYFEELNGTETHIHLAVRIEPHVTPSKFIGDLKGASSFETNKHFKRPLLEWQRGYGVVSFNRKQLRFVVDYIQRQKEHHNNNTTVLRLEATQQQPESRLKPAGKSKLDSQTTT